MQYLITLNEAEDKAFRYVAKNPQEWIQNSVSERARKAMEEIFLMEIQRMTNDPNISEIPADIESVVLSAEITLAEDREASNKDSV